MRIRWTMPAADDLADIRAYLDEHLSHFAESTVRTIYREIMSLKKSPLRGRPGYVTGTRELTLAPLPYLVVYTVKGDSVEVLHIYHGAQDWRRWPV